MQVRYKFADGQSENIEVSEEVAEALWSMDKEWFLIEKRERKNVSLDNLIDKEYRNQFRKNKRRCL